MSKTPWYLPADPYHHFDFLTSGSNPYVQELIELHLDASEGHIHFNGYYYADDSTFPRRHLMLYAMYSDATTMKEEKGYRTIYANQVEHTLAIEIYKREIIENTDVISNIEDDDGESMDVCFFPTNRQTLFFRILRRYDTINDITPEICAEFEEWNKEREKERSNTYSTGMLH
jgi:hypothetical protein